MNEEDERLFLQREQEEYDHWLEFGGPQRRRRIVLNEEETKRFLDMLEEPPVLPPSLLHAIERYKELTRENPSTSPSSHGAHQEEG